jgi:hypothetical protein
MRRLLHELQAAIPVGRAGHRLGEDPQARGEKHEAERKSGERVQDAGDKGHRRLLALRRRISASGQGLDHAWV